jgi:hypothetical protein
MSEYLPGFGLPSTRVEPDAPTQCVRCGRVLKNPASIARGIGPTCARKIETEAQAEFVRMVKERDGAQTSFLS